MSSWVFQWLESDGTWKPYSHAANELLATAYRGGHTGSPVDLGPAGLPYDVNIASKKQTRKGTGYVREVRVLNTVEYQDSDGSWKPYDPTTGALGKIKVAYAAGTTAPVDLGSDVDLCAGSLASRLNAPLEQRGLIGHAKDGIDEVRKQLDQHFSSKSSPAKAAARSR